MVARGEKSGIWAENVNGLEVYISSYKINKS